MARSLLDLKSDPNNQDIFGRSMLHIASISNDLEIIELLLEYKADINLCNKGGFTPMHYALNMRSILDIINQIMPDGVNTPNSDGLTPLHIAVKASKHRFEAVEYLLDHSADINAQTPDGMTPLDLAASDSDIYNILKAHILKAHI